VIGYPDGSEDQVIHEENMGVCLYPHRQASLSIGAFEPPQTRPKWPFVPNVPAQSLRASHGEDLNYVVSLYNVPNRAFEFTEPCPSYVQRIRRSGHVVQAEGLVLNCSGLGPVPGRTAVNFDMTIHIPDDLHGRYMLVWQLDPPFGYNTTIQLTVR
jgi:hypothetical protein